MIGTLLQANTFAHLLAYWSSACLVLYILLLALKVVRPTALRIPFLWLHMFYIAARVTYGVLLGVGQYVHWGANPFTRPLTYLPLTSDVPLPGLLRFFGPLLALRHGYFIEYMLGHFWLGLIWGLLTAFLLYGVLRLLRRRRPGMLSVLDVNLFVAAGLIVGWPNILLLVVCVFLLFILHVSYTTMRKKGRTPLYPSVIIAFVIIFFLGDQIAQMFPIFELLRFTGA